ncbi:unnamed protein product, partial [Gadus morhua 'NCC']
AVFPANVYPLACFSELPFAPDIVFSPTTPPHPLPPRSTLTAHPHQPPPTHCDVTFSRHDLILSE